MPDINFLPDDLRKEEERERQKKADSRVEIPMSSPLIEAKARDGHVGVSQSIGSPDGADPKLKHVREESYIGVNRQGHIVHSEAPKTETARQGVPWWWRFMNRMRRSAPPVPPTVRQQVPAKVPSKEPASESLPFKKIEPSSTKAPAPTSVPPITVSLPTTPPPVVSAPPSPPASASLPPSSGISTPKREAPSLASTLGVNLIPSEWISTPTSAASFRSRVLLVVGTFFLVSIVATITGRLLYTSYQRNQLARLREEQAAIEKDIQSYAASEALWQTLRHRLVTIRNLLQGHINMLPAFTFIETTVLPEVTYERVNVSRTGAVTVHGRTRTHELLAKQVVAIEMGDPKPASVDIASYGVDTKTGDVVFDLTITVNETILRYADQ